MELPSLPVIDGSELHPQSGAGGECWSSVLNVRMEWNGIRWRVAYVPVSLAYVNSGDTVVIPADRIATVSPDAYIDGDLIADGDVIPLKDFD